MRKRLAPSLPTTARPIIGIGMAILLAALAVLSGGCARTPQTTREFTPLEGDRVESQWEMHLVEGGKDTPLTGAMAASLDNPGEGRLYVMLPMGQTLGKCVLADGEASCEGAVPGVGGMLQKAAGPMAKMLSAESDADDVGMFGEDAALPGDLDGSGWRCEADGETLIYREDRAKWTLRLKRIK